MRVAVHLVHLEAAAFVGRRDGCACPVGVMPVRRMTHSPAGTSQRSVPSAASLPVRFTTALRRDRERGGLRLGGAGQTIGDPTAGQGVGCILPSCFSTMEFQPRRAGQFDFRQRGLLSDRLAELTAGSSTAVSVMVTRNWRAVTAGNETTVAPWIIGPTLTLYFGRARPRRSTANSRTDAELPPASAAASSHWAVKLPAAWRSVRLRAVNGAARFERDDERLALGRQLGTARSCPSPSTSLAASATAGSQTIARFATAFGVGTCGAGNASTATS